MLKQHSSLATAIGLIQIEKESEFEFRKRIFMKVYPEDGMEGIEILFGIEHYSQLKESDHLFVQKAREAECRGIDELKEFVDGFTVDPALRYQQSN